MPGGSEHSWTWAAGRRREETSASSPQTVARARRRGLARGALGLAVAAGIALWRPALGAVVGAVAVGVLLSALLAPRSLYPRLESWLEAFARGVGTAVSWTTLTVVHLLVFLPLGVLLRATGSLRIATDLDPEAATYWRPADSTAHHDRQF